MKMGVIVAIVAGVLAAMLHLSKAWAVVAVATALGLAAFRRQIMPTLRWLAMSRSERKRRMEIINSDYGRRAGWLVEHGGQTIGTLADPEFSDMFWESYRLKPSPTTAASLETLIDSNWWRNAPLSFRNERFDTVVSTALCAGLNRDGRIVMRGLYINLESAAIELWVAGVARWWQDRRTNRFS